MSQVNYGPEPMTATCTNCGARRITRVEQAPSGMTHIIALLLLGMCMCCCPYILKCGMKTNHYCSSCNTFLGSYS